MSLYDDDDADLFAVEGEALPPTPTPDAAEALPTPPMGGGGGGGGGGGDMFMSSGGLAPIVPGNNGGGLSMGSMPSFSGLSDFGSFGSLGSADEFGGGQAPVIPGMGGGGGGGGGAPVIPSFDDPLPPLPGGASGDQSDGAPPPLPAYDENEDYGFESPLPTPPVPDDDDPYATPLPALPQQGGAASDPGAFSDPLPAPPHVPPHDQDAYESAYNEALPSLPPSGGAPPDEDAAFSEPLPPPPPHEQPEHDDVFSQPLPSLPSPLPGTPDDSACHQQPLPSAPAPSPVPVPTASTPLTRSVSGGFSAPIGRSISGGSATSSSDLGSPSPLTKESSKEQVMRKLRSQTSLKVLTGRPKSSTSAARPASTLAGSGDLRRRRQQTDAIGRVIDHPVPAPPPPKISYSASDESSRAELHQEVLRDLIVNENAFNKKMRMLVQNFVTPIIQRSEVELPHRGREGVQELFKDISPLQKAHYKLLQKMSRRLKHEWSLTPWMGDLYLLMVPELQMLYRNYNEAIYHINEVVKQDQRFAAIVDQISKSVGESLGNLMLLPVRTQLPTYGKLMKIIIAKTPEAHRDHKFFHLALQQLVMMYKFIAMRKMRLHQVAKEEQSYEVFTREIFIKGEGSIAKQKKGGIVAGLTKASKKLISGGEHTWIIVSGATLQIQRQKGRSKVWPLTSVWMRDIEQLDQSDVKMPNTFELIGPLKSYVLKFGTEDEKVEVMSRINAAWRNVLTKENAPEKGKRYALYKFPQGAFKYEGWWRLGTMHGSGMLISDTTNHYYFGEFNENAKHGVGSFVCPTGKYAGEWKDDQPDGLGIFEYVNGSVYCGQWKDGLRCGRGTLVTVNGSRYQGAWENNVPSGSGSYSVVDGVFYYGHWQNGRPHGRGFLVSNGQCYDGDLVAGRRSGNGKQYYSNGDLYDGEWKNDLYHGKGSFVSAMGTFKGQYLGGIRISGSMMYTNGNMYDGAWKGPLFHGAGKLSTPSGYVKVYDGNWSGGKLSGKCVLQYHDGAKFDGTFKDDRMHGSGSAQYPIGAVYDGKWVDGRREGKFTLKMGASTLSGTCQNGLVQISSMHSILVPPEMPIARILF
eukprot:TRINITY_DN690_c0_g1_i3.p1 TRINITY_DN690_c0_g1~~TRINITY_DN690_c0_g1_i3.p1  ORF type:complete len:1083 (+),score=200.50 TRINITY_DN690_c0_g1_i3:162-3410(+)